MTFPLEPPLPVVPMFSTTCTFWVSPPDTREMVPVHWVALLTLVGALTLTVRVAGVVCWPAGETLIHEPPQFEVAAETKKDVAALPGPFTVSVCAGGAPPLMVVLYVRVELLRVRLPVPPPELPVTSKTTGMVRGLFAAPEELTVMFAVLMPLEMCRSQ